MNLNKVFLIGKLTNDPELRTLPSGQPVVSFGLATNRYWYDQNRQRQEQVEFHNIVIFGRPAEIAHQYLKKGSTAFFEGRLKTRSWEGNDGQKKYRTEVVAERIQLGPRPTPPVGGKEVGEPAPASAQTEPLPEINIDESEIKTEDLPF